MTARWSHAGGVPGWRLLRQPDRMHQLDQGPGIEPGFCGQLPTVLINSLAGAQEADDGLFPLSTLI